MSGDDNQVNLEAHLAAVLDHVEQLTARLERLRGAGEDDQRVLGPRLPPPEEGAFRQLLVDLDRSVLPSAVQERIRRAIVTAREQRAYEARRERRRVTQEQPGENASE